MAELEYSELFAVYITPTQGLKVLVNPMLVRIADAVQKTEMTAAELSEMLGISRSTVRSGLDRLCDMDILTTRKSDSDARLLLFTVHAIEVVHSTEPVNDDSISLDRIDRLHQYFRESRPMPIYESILVAVTEMRSRGVIISRILFETGMSIGLTLSHTVCKMSDEELSQEAKKDLGLDLDLSIKADSDGIRVEAIGRDVATILLIRELFMGFIIGTMNVRNGVLYAQHYTTEVDEKTGRVTFTSPVYSRTVRHVHIPNYMVRENVFYRIDEPFMAIRTDAGCRYMITNRNMISILDTINDGYRSPVSISKQTGIPHMTVHAVLTKLEAIGAV